MTFDSENEAYEFYNMSSWEVGFGIKKDNIRGNGICNIVSANGRFNVRR